MKPTKVSKIIVMNDPLDWELDGIEFPTELSLTDVHQHTESYFPDGCELNVLLTNGTEIGLLKTDNQWYYSRIDQGDFSEPEGWTDTLKKAVDIVLRKSLPDVPL